MGFPAALERTRAGGVGLSIPLMGFSFSFSVWEVTCTVLSIPLMGFGTNPLYLSNARFMLSIPLMGFIFLASLLQLAGEPFNSPDGILAAD